MNVKEKVLEELESMYSRYNINKCVLVAGTNLVEEAIDLTETLVREECGKELLDWTKKANILVRSNERNRIKKGVEECFDYHRKHERDDLHKHPHYVRIQSGWLLGFASCWNRLHDDVLKIMDNGKMRKKHETEKT